MVNRLPEYMNAFSKGTLTFGLLDCIGDELEKAENNIASIMTSKWFPVASLPDLERIGSLFGVERLSGEDLPTYKLRLYQTVQELLKGVGTVDSIRGIVTAAMGIEPEIIENPTTPIDSGPRLLKAGDKWSEECRSAIQQRPIITIQSLTTVRNPTIANIYTEESVTYIGLLRPGAFLRIYPDNTASLAGIDVSERIETSHGKIPKLTRPFSDWVYQDMNAFLDSGTFDYSTLAGAERYSVIIRLYWAEAKPASFIVKLPLYSNKHRPTDQMSKDELMKSVGYEQELRQEVRNLVDKVKTAGVDAQINFWDDFTEQNQIKDRMRPQLNHFNFDKMKIGEQFEITGEANFTELHKIKDDFSFTGAFDITSFDSENRFG
jgi:hypothetical protein